MSKILTAIKSDADVLLWARFSIRYNGRRSDQARDFIAKMQAHKVEIEGATPGNIATALRLLEQEDSVEVLEALQAEQRAREVEPQAAKPTLIATRSGGEDVIIDETNAIVATVIDAKTAKLLAAAANERSALITLLRDIRGYPDALMFRPDLLKRIDDILA